MYRSKHSHRNFLGKAKSHAAAGEGEILRAENEIAGLAAEQVFLGSGHEVQHHCGEMMAAQSRLEKASARFERKEAERLARPAHVRVVAAPILSRPEREALRSAQIEADRAMASVEEEAKARVEAKGKKPTDFDYVLLLLRAKSAILAERAMVPAVSAVSAVPAVPAVPAVHTVSAPVVSAPVVSAPATAVSAQGGSGSRADADLSWRRSAPAVMAPTRVSAGLPRALDTLLSNHPVCYKAMGEGRFSIEIHNKKLHELSMRERREIRAKEVEASLLLALEASGLCSIGSGSWSALCVIRV